MKNLQTATDEFLKEMSSPTSTNKDINAALQECYKLMDDSNDDEIGIFMQRTFELNKLPDLERASLATIICGSLVEGGFPSETILKPCIDLYENLLDRSRPVYEMFYSLAQKVDQNDEEYDDKINTIFSDLMNDKEMVNQDMYTAVVSLEKFYAAAISIFSVSKENFYAAKSQLESKMAYVGDNNSGTYWLNKLFTVLFDEPVIVIDFDQNIGFEGTINGIVDNYQLQHLLMGLPFLNNGNTAISEENLAISDGTGPQSGEDTITSKWDMYNLDICKASNWQDLKNNDNSGLSISLREYWIWSEGAPVDISVHNGYRVILLNPASISRSTRIQRTFKNLEASIEIVKELSAGEIDNWLNHIK
ncbi:MAG: hypothetical protein E6767_14315 [Dysgonomonas sp.]|nr:hypothetical protein [Dysgonomonas sp.]